jgi:hypothetical protein
MKKSISLSNGFFALCRDPAGTIALLVLTIVTVLCLKGKIGDVSFAAVCSMLPVVIAALKHRSFSGSDIDQEPPNPLPPRGSL